MSQINPQQKQILVNPHTNDHQSHQELKIDSIINKQEVEITKPNNQHTKPQTHQENDQQKKEQKTERVQKPRVLEVEEVEKKSQKMQKQQVKAEEEQNKKQHADKVEQIKMEGQQEQKMGVAENKKQEIENIHNNLIVQNTQRQQVKFQKENNQIKFTEDKQKQPQYQQFVVGDDKNQSEKGKNNLKINISINYVQDTKKVDQIHSQENPDQEIVGISEQNNKQLNEQVKQQLKEQVKQQVKLQIKQELKLETKGEELQENLNRKQTQQVIEGKQQDKIQFEAKDEDQLQHQSNHLKNQPKNGQQPENLNPRPIIMTQQNQNLHNKTVSHVDNEEKQKIVEFEQYLPKSNHESIRRNQNEIKNENQIKKIKAQLPTQYQNIQNNQLLKRIQQLQQTVSLLKKQKQSKVNQINEQNSDMQPTQTQTIDAHAQSNQKKKKKKEQIIHDQSVHGLVTQLAKTDVQGIGKKPILQQKRYKRRKLDLSALMDKNMTHASNIFNVTIGQILNPNRRDQEQKQALRKQIKNLRQKVLKLQEDKRALSTQKAPLDTRRETASTGKKSLCGKLIKVSQLKGSRITCIQDSDSLYKVNHQFGETKSQRQSVVQGITFRNKITNNSSTQRQERISDKQKENPNNISFRVRRPSNRFTSGSNTPLNQTYEKQKVYDTTNEQKISIFPVSSVQFIKQNDDKKQKEKKQQKDKANDKQVNQKQWWQQPFINTLKMPDLPSPPTQFDIQEDLYTLGKLTFIAFGVDLDSSSQMTVKKYKNCVYFHAGQKNNILWYFDGRFYFGEWQVHLTGQGQKSGEGFEHVPGKYIYQGNFKEGKRNGFGKMKILNKQKDVIYQGNWVDGNKNGQGKQVDQYDVKYWGEWKQNKRQGFGRLKLHDGDYFQGNFQRGIKTGLGTQLFKNGDKYIGNYLANKFHGKGKYFWKNGSVYEGDFNHGIRSGNGKWKSSEVTQQFDEYDGQYDNDKKNGFGKYRWADGSEYQGFFKDDLKEGEGTIRYKNGKVAKLLWKNGQPMKKIFSEEERNYRQGQKTKQKIGKQSNNAMNRNQTVSSRQFSLLRQQ